jgi:DNA-binding MarR family transcriptional regulator
MYSLPPPADTSALHDESLPILIARARNGVLRMLEAELAASGVSTVQCMILLRLYRGGRNTAGALSRFSGVDSGAMTRLLDRLAAKGLLARSPDQKDRRSVRLILTERATALVPELERCVQRVHQHLLHGSGSTDAMRFSAYLVNVIHQTVPAADLAAMTED